MKWLALFLSPLAFAACPNPITNGYSFCRMITISHLAAPSTQSNLPVPIVSNGFWIKTTAYGGHVQNTSGFDVIFTSDAAGTTLLTWEPAVFGASSGNFEYWVKIASFSNSADTVIYMYYGNAAITTSQTTATSTWDANYLGVWHFGDGSTLSLADSTSNGNTLTLHGTVLAMPGKIGGGAAFIGQPVSTNFLTASATGTDINGAALTIESWSRFEGSYMNGVFPSIVFKKSPTNTVGFELNIASNDDILETPNRFYYELATGSSALSDTVNAPLNTWTRIDVDYGLTGTATTSDILRNSVKTASLATGFPASSTGNLFNIGINWSGVLDEIRLSKVARSQDWITTNYNLQSNPAAYVQIGAEFPVGTASTVIQ